MVMIRRRTRFISKQTHILYMFSLELVHCGTMSLLYTTTQVNILAIFSRYRNFFYKFGCARPAIILFHYCGEAAGNKPQPHSSASSKSNVLQPWDDPQVLSSHASTYANHITVSHSQFPVTPASSSSPIILICQLRI